MIVTLADVIARLDAQNKWRVQGAAGLAAAQTDSKSDQVFVLLLGDASPGFTADGYTGTGAIQRVQQVVTTRIGVVIAARNLRDKRGDGALSDLEEVRQGVRDALLGWLPREQASPLMFVQGRLLDFADKTVWWQDEYEFQHLVGPTDE